MTIVSHNICNSNASSLASLPSVPCNWSSENGTHTKIYSKCSKVVENCPFERVGRYFLSHLHRVKRNRTISEEEVENEKKSAENCKSDSEETSSRFDAQVDLESMKLTFEDAKNQDHYKILGLSKLRYKATEDDIKKAYKKLVLKHHPDKKGKSEDCDDIFKCIQIANDQLSDPERRRAFDSVDPEFDESIPAASAQNKKHFFAVFAPVVERNARWSVEQPVPLLGELETPFEEVEEFYNFWYDFQSWREFSYLDEEDTKNAECREEKRYLERKNKAERARRKEEDNLRINQLVDTLMACDPRILLHKEREKQRREQVRLAKENAIKQARMEAQKREEDRRLEELRVEAMRREEAAEDKKNKEAARKAIRKERKTFRNFCKDSFCAPQNVDEDVIQRIEGVEKICESLPVEELAHTNLLMNRCPENSLPLFYALLERISAASAAKIPWPDFLANLNLFPQNLQDSSPPPPFPPSLPEKTCPPSNLAPDSRPPQNPASAQNHPNKPDSHPSVWREQEITLLIKAVKQIPVGSRNRYESILSFLQARIPDTKLTCKDVIQRVNDMKKVGSTLGEEKAKINQDAFSKLEKTRKKSHTEILSDLTIRDDGKENSFANDSSPIDDPPQNSPAKKSPASSPLGQFSWSPDEQKLLEAALKIFPASFIDRWEKIAQHVATRSKKECMLRYKEIADAIKARKTASKNKK